LLARKHQLEENYRPAASINSLVQDRLNKASYAGLSYKGLPLLESVSTLQASFLERLLSVVSSMCIPTKRLGSELLALIPDEHGMRDNRWGKSALGFGLVTDTGKVYTPVSFSEQSQDRLEKLGTLGLLGLAMFGWIYAMAKRLFLPGSKPAPPLTPVTWTSVTDIHASYTLIGHARSGKSTRIRRIAGLKPGRDMRRTFDRAVHLNPITADEFSGDQVIVLDHFDFDIDNPEVNLMRLELLEDLLYEHKANVVLISTIDPLYYFTEERNNILSKDSDPARITRLFDRWSRALSKFIKAEFVDSSYDESALVRSLASVNRTGSSNTSSNGMAVFHGWHWRDRLNLSLNQMKRSILDGRTLGSDIPDTGSNFVVVDHLEAAPACVRLAVLENLAARPKGSAWIFSNTDPLAALNSGMPADVQAHWKQVLAKYVHVGVPPGADATAYTPDRVLGFARLVYSECNATAFLRRNGASLLEEYLSGEPGCDKLQAVETPLQMARVLLDRVDSYYGALWSSMTENERLVLYQLAMDGWANPLNERAIQQLQRKEFICKDAMYRIMNESFRRFVLSVSDSLEVQSWRVEEEASSWRSWRAALVTIFIGLAAWLLYAQKDLFQVTLTYILTLGGAITGVFNLLGGLTRKSDGGPKSA
jgi:hypothetical protein